MWVGMLRTRTLLAATLFLAFSWTPARAHAAAAARGASSQSHRQETGFLNRTIVVRGIVHHFQVYLPEDWTRDKHHRWPIILFLHGIGERGSEGMWQTQVGLPAAVRDHPERWPFIIVMPQCPHDHYWTDPSMLAMAMAALKQESAEFNADPERTYLTGLSLGGYGVWELARLYPDRWAAIAIASGGIFWSYSPERWRGIATLPAEYARAVGHTPIWLFHGSNDHTVPTRESELMFEAVKANGGHIRLWIYQGLGHNSWTRAYDEPDLPRWLLDHRRLPHEELPALAQHLVIPLHPPALRLTPAQLDAFTGNYYDMRGQRAVTLFRQGDQLYQKNIHGDIAELAAESPSVLFYPNGSSITRIFVERDTHGDIAALVLHDDRHAERWDRIRAAPSSSGRD